MNTLEVVLIVMRKSRFKLLAPTLGICAALAMIFSIPAAGGQTRVGGIEHGRIPGTEVACFHEGVHRFTAKVEPNRCTIAGRNTASGKFASFPVERVRWEAWGQFRSIGRRAWNRQKHVEVQVVAYRRVRCSDGKVWYSRANMLNINNGHGFEVELPVCDDPSIVG